MYNDFMDQLLNYSMDSKHDDAPDSMSLWMIYASATGRV
jgi:hypothetical protein